MPRLTAAIPAEYRVQEVGHELVGSVDVVAAYGRDGFGLRGIAGSPGLRDREALRECQLTERGFGAQSVAELVGVDVVGGRDQDQVNEVFFPG